MYRKDLTGKRFGKLVALRWDKTEKGIGSFWEFQCDCGEKKIIRGASVSCGNTLSCGCWERKIHGDSSSDFYLIWKRIVTRTNGTSNAESRKLYMGLERFKSYEEFKSIMYKSYLEHVKKFGARNTTIDRKNPELGYVDGNCRWLTKSENCRFTRKAKFFTYKGKKQTIRQWAKEYGVWHTSIVYKLKKGLTFRQVINQLNKQYDGATRRMYF